MPLKELAGEWSFADHPRRVYDKLARELGSTLCDWLSDSQVVEILLNPDGQLWLERLEGGLQPAGRMSATQAEALMTTVASLYQTTLTRETPILECELPWDGSRFEALMPPVVRAPVFSIRRRASQVFTLQEYVAQGALSPEGAACLRQAIAERRNLLIVGGTGSGKTTFANALMADIAEQHPSHRLVILEDTTELQCAAPNVVCLRATDEVPLARLLRATLRLRPDRIIVGEVRGGEALSLLKAWNTGHPGGVATVHANHALAGLHRLEQLVAEALPTPMPHLIGEAIDLVVTIEKTAHGRRVSELLAVHGHDGQTYCVEPRMACSA